jgi:sulfonate transport system ATP-binding protein
MAPRVRAVTAGGGSAPFDDALASQAAASVRGLTRRFGDRVVLDGLDLDIGRGEFVAMIGRSGSGKSTLLRALAGLDQDVTGSLGVAGPVAVAFQEPRLVPWQRVLANVALGLRVPEPARMAAAALDEVGLTERAAAWPLTLSGGEAQRASLDEALAFADRVLVLRDGRIAHSSAISVPRPRDRDHPSLTALRLRLLTELGVPAEATA